MKKIMIHAYTANNVGDDLFIYLLCQRYPEAQFYLYAAKRYNQTFSSLHNLTILPSDSLIQRIQRRILRFMKQEYRERNKLALECDASVYIGGSLFMENQEWLVQYENVRSILSLNRPFFILGANFGPFYSEEFLNKYQALFEKCDDICFRDQASYHLFHHLTNVRWASDLVFQLPNHNLNNKEKHIVISVIYPSIRKELTDWDQDYFQQIKRIAEIFLKQGYQIVFAGFCKQEKDHLAVDKILSLIREDYRQEVKVFSYQHQLDSLIQLIKEAKAVIATRFHAMILGFLFQKPTFPLIYSEKMVTVIQDMKFEGGYWRFEHLHQITKEELLAFDKQILTDLANQIASSEKQFLALDKLILQ